MPNLRFREGDPGARSGPTHGVGLPRRKGRPPGGLGAAARGTSGHVVRSPTIAGQPVDKVERHSIGDDIPAERFALRCESVGIRSVSLPIRALSAGASPVSMPALLYPRTAKPRTSSSRPSNRRVFNPASPAENRSHRKTGPAGRKVVHRPGSVLGVISGSGNKRSRSAPRSSRSTASAFRCEEKRPRSVLHLFVDAAFGARPAPVECPKKSGAGKMVR